MENKNIETIRHSLAHIMASAVGQLYPGTKFGIGPAIENGFYYDFQLPQQFSDKDILTVENKMRALLKQGIAFKKKTITKIEAKELFKEQPYKLELIGELPDSEITVYSNGNFTDLCKGPHIATSSEIPADAFKLTKIAGAYWRGSEKNQMLTRIYGVAFENKKELDNYLKVLEEAEKRDHRTLGKDLNLFMIDPVNVGLGLVMWQPKGALLWRLMEDFWYQEHLKNGYELVRSPHIGSRKLWETSGHWGFYNENMYPPLEVGQSLKELQEGKTSKTKEEYLIKPMNCPFHVTLYNSAIRSYKDLPIRWAECGTVYRYEKSGELSGLTRVRGFTQDDAHIICTKEQAKKELKRVADFILFILKTFGFKDFNVYLSLRDPKDKKKYAGNDEGWNFTEAILEEVAKEQKLNYKKEEGEAAFYGPKLDYKIKDCLGREWQCSTLQFDFNLPERFDMTFVNKNGEKERPYMLLRALFGSFERFIGVLIEHYAGAFPLWIAPVQVEVINISDTHKKYAKTVYEELIENGIRAEFKDENLTLGKRIREAEMQKIPYLLIIGDKEMKAKSVAVRKRSKGDLGAVKLSKFIKNIKEEIINKK
jgi:threonyl-tRNA synthetase